VYERLETLGRRVADGTRRNLEELGLPAAYVGIGSLGCLYFRAGPAPRAWSEVCGADTARFAVYFHEMLRRGLYLAPSQFEAAFLCAAHTEEEIDRMLVAQREALVRAYEVRR
jgi:glutamate-1-semialdehyde 2,1-aminomutase